MVVAEEVGVVVEEGEGGREERGLEVEEGREIVREGAGGMLFQYVGCIVY